MLEYVFISYASSDRAVAETICQSLEAKGHRCWIASRDIPPGTAFVTAIMNAIHDCRAMVLILSPQSNVSQHVKNEVTQAVDKGKRLFPFRIAEIQPSDEISYYIKPYQWTDGFPPPLEEKIQRLSEAIYGLGRKERTPNNSPVTTTPRPWSPRALPRTKATWLLRLLPLVLLAFVGVLGWRYLTINGNQKPEPSPAAPSSSPIAQPSIRRTNVLHSLTASSPSPSPSRAMKPTPTPKERP